MTDLEIRKACAEAMGLPWEGAQYVYDPLHDDAQAMALLQKFGPEINMMAGYFDCEWVVNVGISQPIVEVHHDTDLNHAICLCVAKLKAHESA